MDESYQAGAAGQVAIEFRDSWKLLESLASSPPQREDDGDYPPLVGTDFMARILDRGAGGPGFARPSHAATSLAIRFKQFGYSLSRPGQRMLELLQAGWIAHFDDDGIDFYGPIGVERHLFFPGVGDTSPGQNWLARNPSGAIDADECDDLDERRSLAAACRGIAGSLKMFGDEPTAVESAFRRASERAIIGHRGARDRASELVDRLAESGLHSVLSPQDESDLYRIAQRPAPFRILEWRKNRPRKFAGVRIEEPAELPRFPVTLSDDRQKRFLAYVAKRERPDSRDEHPMVACDQVYGFACDAVRFGLTEAEAVPLIEWFASQDIGPRRESLMRDAGRKYREAQKVARFGEKLMESDRGGAVNLDGIMGTKPAAVGASPATAAEPTTGMYQWMTAAELDAGEFAIKYIVDGTVVAGQPLLVAGSKKCLKTSIVLDLSISLAAGAEFLGSFKVEQQTRVAFMSGESGKGTIQETARRICESRGITLRDCGDNFIFTPDLPRIADARHQIALEAAIRDRGVQMLVLDPAYLVLPGDDAGNLFKQGEMLRSLSAICERSNASLVLCHHTKRGIGHDQFAPPELEDIAWAGFQEFARQWLLLGRRERYEPGSGLHKLWLSVGGSAGHSALHAIDIEEGVQGRVGGRFWNVSLCSAAEAKRQTIEAQKAAKADKHAQAMRTKIDAARDGIERAFIAASGADTKRRIQDASGHKGANFDIAFAELTREGRIVPDTIVRNNGQKYEGYRWKYDRAA